MARANTAEHNERKGYVESLPYCNKCRLNHKGPCTVKYGNYKRVGHMARDCTAAAALNTQRALVRNQPRNKTGNNEATTRAYAIEGGGANPNSNVITGTFLLNNCYASMLFGLGADKSFVSSTFSALLDVAPSTLDTSYAIKLADGRISETNIILRGCTFGLLGHPFDIDLMLVELGSFDVIISGIGWRSTTLKVFPEDLHGLPPARQVEFQIDLVHGAAPAYDEVDLEKRKGNENFVVYCDASHKGLGAVLMQKEKVVAYVSCQLKVHEKNYITHDLELGAVVFSLKIQRHYLYGTKCVMFTDHKSLQYILDQKELNMRQRRWLELLSEYDCEIRYHPGKVNMVSNVLSRKEMSKPLKIRALVMTIGLNLPKQISNAQSEARKEENFIAEDLHGIINKLEPRTDETLCLNNRS
ncbi:putative reverse transcriptase domain-containing protein [Tanacetum coccineum]